MSDTPTTTTEPEAVEATPEVDFEDFDWEGFGDALEDTPEGEAQVFTVTIDGKEQEVTLEEALQGYQRQADYTRKTQELAQYRQALQPLEQLAVALDANPEETLRLLAKDLGVKFATEVAEAVMDSTGIDPLQETVSQLQARLDAQDQQAALQRARTEIVQDLTKLQQQYGDYDADALLDFASQHKIQDLHAAYGAWQWQLAQAAPEDQSAAITAAKQRQTVVESEPGRSSAGLAPGGGRKMTLRESLRAALNQG